MAEAVWPTELRVPTARDELIVTFEDGHRAVLPAEYLRVFTPSAERTGHGQRQVIGGKRGVRIEAVTPVGHYAARIRFDDGHDSGIYRLASLRPLAADYATNWQTYERELSLTGLDRSRPGTAPAPS